ncbi:hypothetical protein D3C86_1928050 [compost metagenome]
MIDAVAVKLWSVDVVEGKLHTEIDVKVALCLANQSQIRVVHQYMDIRQVELRTDGQFLDHELKIIVARQCDDLATWICFDHTQCCRNSPA